MESTKQCRSESVLFDVSHMCGLSLRVRPLPPERCATWHTPMPRPSAVRSRRLGRAVQEWRLPLNGSEALLQARLPARHSAEWAALNSRCSLQGKDAVAFIERLVVGDIGSLSNGNGTLSVMTNERGGIIDDTVITKVRLREKLPRAPRLCL